MKFTEDMIGRRIKEIGTGDEGIIFSVFKDKFGTIDSECVYVQWSSGDYTGETLHILLNEVVFIDSTASTPDANAVLVEIAGVKYRLVPV